MIPVITVGCFLVKTGAGGHIHLAAQHGIDPGIFAGTIKVDHAVHNAVVGDSGRSHTEFLDAGDIFFYLVRPIKERILRVGV